MTHNFIRSALRWRSFESVNEIPGTWTPNDTFKPLWTMLSQILYGLNQDSAYNNWYQNDIILTSCVSIRCRYDVNSMSIWCRFDTYMFAGGPWWEQLPLSMATVRPTARAFTLTFRITGSGFDSTRGCEAAVKAYETFQISTNGSNKRIICFKWAGC